MKKYIGTKVIEAKPSTYFDFLKVMGRTPAEGAVDSEGYIVRYEDGYTSFSPKVVFEKAYHVFNDMSFGMAIDALRIGLAIRRKGWNGKGMFVVKQIPAHITEEIIPKMQSLPQSAKDIIMSRENKVIDYTSQMLIINLDGRADSWVPSVSDVFAEDWEVVE